MHSDDPFGGFGRLANGMKILSERMARLDEPAASAVWEPAVDIFETETEVVLIAEVAGVKPDKVKIMVDGDVVRIYGERPPTCCDGFSAQFHRMEIESGAFARHFRITVPFDPKKVNAKVNDGFLTISLPKRGDTNIEVERG